MNEQQWTIIRVLKWTRGYFASHGIEQARVDAEVLLAHVLGYHRLELYLNFDQPLTKSELAAYREVIKRRAGREPVQYITGKQEFWSLPLKVNPAVLIPRPETECLVEQVLEVVREVFSGKRSPRILEIGTGSGAIALALAHELPNATIFACDISIEALEVAKENLQELEPKTSVFLFASDLFGALKATPTGYFDLIVSNPPYVSSNEYEKLPPEIKNFEPRHALYGGKNGTSVIEKIIAGGEPFLAPGGSMVMEIGSNQGNRLEKLAGSLPWVAEVAVKKDYSGLDRIIVLRKHPR